MGRLGRDKDVSRGVVVISTPCQGHKNGLQLELEQRHSGFISHGPFNSQKSPSTGCLISTPPDSPTSEVYGFKGATKQVDGFKGSCSLEMAHGLTMCRGALENVTSHLAWPP